MASSKILYFFIAMLSISALCCKSDEQEPVEDPVQIVAKALFCFNNQEIYASCKEDYRLNENGNIDVPREATDEYCNGPCLTETHLVLNCVEDILSNFLFYNKATIQDIRSTLTAGCGYTSSRGNFNVAEHIQADSNHALKHVYPMRIFILVGWGLLL